MNQLSESNFICFFFFIFSTHESVNGSYNGKINGRLPRIGVHIYLSEAHSSNRRAAHHRVPEPRALGVGITTTPTGAASKSLEDRVYGLSYFDYQEGFLAELHEHLYSLSGGPPQLGQSDEVDVAEDCADDEQRHAHGRHESDEAHEAAAARVLLTLVRKNGETKKGSGQGTRDVGRPADPATTQQRWNWQRGHVRPGQQQHRA